MENLESESKIKFNIYRFKIEDKLLELLKRFTIEHQFENRRTIFTDVQKWA